ncbi:GPI inositol-deacylase isoform X2 [Hyla sarda]|uniref:GPI inositol-deacylase isoform X2 n=1 Tax=Hyla sarda TaxID=327740 RepID=UPI0024C420D0|nr:GPI inositol-deacylase isoform X2 [Hyla sarda]
MKLISAVFNGFVVLLVAFGVMDVLFVYEDNRCSMTYMFEYPEYQKIQLSKKVSILYPAYELHLYGEGVHVEENRNLSLTGIPVLFLPGNAGSYRQVRSIGSVALRKAENIDYRYHFNIFSINFNEELVALYGGSLQKQTQFVHISIKAILRLYKNQEFPPRSVMLLGHSMGGLIARALFTLKNFKPQLINLIITQATPHVMPVLPIDYYLTDFYALVNDYWNLNADKLQNITILSIAGGFRDYQVRSGLTFLPSLKIKNSTLSVVSTTIPRTWASTDHLSIVWCKELVLVTSRALFDLIDGDTRQITEDSSRRMDVLKHHFIRHPAKLYESSYKTTMNVPETSRWFFIKTRNWVLTVTKAYNETCFVFPLQDKRKTYNQFHCRSTFLFTHSWIFGCDDHNSSKCQSQEENNSVDIEDLSWRAELLPTAKAVTLKLEDYSNTSHFLLYLPATNNSKFSVECEFLNDELTTTQLPVTHAFSFGLSSNHIKINSSGLLHVLCLQGFSKMYQAFNILIERNCTQSIDTTSTIYRLHVPWSHEDIIRVPSDDLPLQLSAKLHVPRPQNDSSMVTITLYTFKDCHYEVKIYTSFVQMLGQIIRIHWPLLNVYIVSNLLLAFGAQLYSISSKGFSLEFDASLDIAAKPYKVEPIIGICQFLLSYDWFRDTWDSLLLPHLDSSELYSMNLLFPLGSLFLFIFGTGIAYWSGMLFKSTIGMLSSMWSTLKRSMDVPKESKPFTNKLLAEAIFFTIVAWRTCGAFAILLLFLRYLLKVVKLQANLWSLSSSKTKAKSQMSASKPTTTDSSITTKNSEEPICEPQKDPELYTCDLHTAAENINMHISVLNLLLWLTLLTIPGFIYWFKNFRNSIQLVPDPVRVLAIILIFTVEILMNSTVLSMNSSKLLKITAQLQLPFSVLVVAFGQLHLYRVPYFITFSLFLHSLSCFI